MPAAFSIEYFHPQALATIEAWPVDTVADYAQLVELLSNRGPAVGMPHARAKSMPASLVSCEPNLAILPACHVPSRATSWP